MDVIETKTYPPARQDFQGKRFSIAVQLFKEDWLDSMKDKRSKAANL